MKTRQHSPKNLLDRINLFFSQLFADEANASRKRTSPAHVASNRAQYRPESRYLGETADDNENKYPGTYPFLYRYR